MSHYAFALPSGTAGNNTFGGEVGDQLTVGPAAITVPSLAAFLDATAPWSAAKPVNLWNATTGALLATVTIAPGDSAATLVGQYLYKPLTTPITVPAGTSLIISASGYGTDQFTLDSSGKSGPAPTEDGNSGALSFTGDGIYNLTAGSMPGTVVYNLAPYGAASFAYSTASGASLSISPTSATATDGGATVAITPTLTGSTAALTASVSGGGTISTTAPTSGTAFTYTPPASGSGTATVTIADATDSLSRSASIGYGPGGVITVAPATVPLGVVTPVTITGHSGTNITESSFPTVSGGTNAYFSNLSISGQVITGWLNPGTSAGTLTIGDGSTDGATATITATAAVTTNIVYHGDSLTEGVNGTGDGTASATRLATAAAGLGPAAQVVNQGHGGHTLTQMTAELGTTVNALYDPSKAFNILNAQGAHNDLKAYQTIAQIQTSITTYIATAKAAHPWLVVWSTELPAASTSYPANFDSQVAILNTWLRANWRSIGIDYLSDVASDARIGLAGSEYNATYFGSDLTHPIDPGYVIWGGYDLAAFRALIGLGTMAATLPAPANVLTTAAPYGYPGALVTPTYVATTPAQTQAGVTFGASGSLTGTFAGSGGGGGSGTAQTGDVYALLNPLIVAGAFSAPALANAPKTGLALGATGLNAIPGFNGWSFPQLVRAIGAFLLGRRTGVPASGSAGSVTYSDPASSTAYGTVTVDNAGNITANAMTPIS